MPAAVRTVRLSLCASHLGYPMDRTPLGGGAVVAEALAQRWAADPRLELSLFGSGLGLELARYVRIGGQDRPLTSLSELAYARFCRAFEREATRRLEAARPDVAVINDVSESPDLARLAAARIRILSIWHVDVADFFSRMYLFGAPTRSAVGLYEKIRRFRSLLPDVGRLVFEKQRDSVIFSDRIVVPSKGVKERILECYAFVRGIEKKILVVPWGHASFISASTSSARTAVREEFGLSEDTFVLLTLSRISPEKGLPRLFEALKGVRGNWALFVCGAPAFMQGEREMRRLQSMAKSLKNVRVFFPGYVSGERKAAFLAAADVFVAPSVHESYGLSAAEALAAGLPVVGAANMGMKELLSGGGGRLVEEGAGFSDKLAAALEALAADPAERARLADEARQAAPGFDAAAARLADEAAALAGVW